jgi:PKD repeat protein
MAALAVAVVTAACDKAQLLAPTSSTIAVSAATRALPLGATTEISAVVVEQAGTPVQNGTTVRFTTNLGTVNPVEAQTRNGIATTTFSAGSTSGTAQIRATSGAAAGGTGEAATNVVSIAIGAASATAITVSASPSRVPSAGGTVTVSAAVLDAAGNPLPNVPVTFSANAGSLSASVANTDDTGVARVQLTTSRTTTVSVRAGNVAAVTTEVGVGSAPTVGLTVSPTSPTAGSPVTLTITPTIPTGGAAPRVIIDWGDGTTQDLGTVGAARTVTHTYTASGAYTITASATSEGESSSNAISVIVGARPSPTLTVSPSSGTTSTTFTFTVTPAATGLPARNVTLDFGDGSTVELGAITTATTVSHRYTSANTYTARATQTDSSGGTSSGVVIVPVS